MKLDVLKGEPTALIQIAFARNKGGRWGGGVMHYRYFWRNQTTSISYLRFSHSNHVHVSLLRSSCRTLICEHAQGGKGWESFGGGGGLKCYKGTTHINDMIL